MDLDLGNVLDTPSFIIHPNGMVFILCFYNPFYKQKTFKHVPDFFSFEKSLSKVFCLIKLHKKKGSRNIFFFT